LGQTIRNVVVSFLFLAAPAAGETLIYHEVKTDSSGSIVPWYGNGPAQAYDHVIRLVWDFWRNMRLCPNGVPYYLQHQVWKPDKDDERGLGGDQISMALSSWNLLHAYTGERAVKDNMILMADYWLEHGMSHADAKWPNLPYPYNLELHSGVYDGDMRAGRGYLQPDKAGSFAAELITLYKITGKSKYLDAAIKIANTLAARVQPADADHSPWPYRVNTVTGEVHRDADKKSGKTLTATYTSNWTGALRTFNDLIAMKRGDIPAYSRAAKIVTDWLKAYPLKTNKWGPFFEDIPTAAWSDTEINADTLAAYILEHPTFDPSWKALAKRVLDWSYSTFQNHEFEKWNVIAINEQTAYKVPGNSHTSRHASVELLYCEKTGDCGAKEAAVRRLNWATYMVDADGKNKYPRDDNWLTDGYGDYVRHYLRAMAAAPELAPEDQNHLLRTSSVLQEISYGDDAVTYKKFDARSAERLKMGAWSPAAVSGGTMQWDSRTKVLTVSATARTVVVRRAR
jgi:hypothetical protein